ncbi:biopolymer transport protein TolR [Bathymodiolus platifrons methanotrophic gill symbiont]|uniref:protein TolR n=2 Tax=Bathymodiolus platifrons methanotrophic gill symbiont TaxID=113268 RepID=UPI000B40A500|nr:protein TolR [Bathymodiolus platifrons methanotrophic gill symbiont]MCK5869781.1 protein TolR [Methyloprofundus sp.]TXK97047.1 protein TolR [Methylococcaceae bacterium CS4]TXK99380.1 protein TolR [Methylococcaceae bacterium CS5]TXL00742.1 protein TolR [Methylococcaceae bacterium HT1]TXL05029.1 protein TolR [Methylococcaceae bacterium CS1]TXL05470.1 protein TolR [Methylococcaceae bacterium CS3]TXL09994.1 protein TolR [Methylococcaceae bacterium CS2]TXL14924.1 protein TolR [Methylococcacea
MAKRARRKPMAEINVVPYIDVTLVLLIIFMITAPLIQSGVDVDLPVANAEDISLEDLPDPVIITITKTGQFYIDLGNGEDDEPVTAKEVLILTQAVRKNKPATQVYIRGDKQVEYGKVVTVMSALKNAGVPNVGLMTENF